jgi:MFS family permease
MDRKWFTLSNTIVGTFLTTVNISMIMAALPSLITAFGLSPASHYVAVYAIWLITGYTLIMATLTVMLGRLSDIYGRIRMYRIGFVIFIIASFLLATSSSLIELVIFRFILAIGGALLMVNVPAILTDAFKLRERGKAIGINQFSTLAGTALGFLIGGYLASINWSLIFIVNIPIGIAGLAWSYITMEEHGRITRRGLDPLGTVLLTAAMLLILTGISSGVSPYGHSYEGWANPSVIGYIIFGVVLLAAFAFVEGRVKDPILDLHLFKIRDFSIGNFSQFCASLARQGLLISLILLFQGIWLPLHGYGYSSSEFLAAVYILPFLIAFVAFGPMSGYLSDIYGPRLFTTIGLVIAAVGFLMFLIMPYNFNYIWFSPELLIIGVGLGLFSSPNTADTMSSVPSDKRGTASGTRSTVTNAAIALSTAIYFAMIIHWMAPALHGSIVSALKNQGVSQSIYSSITVKPQEAIFASLIDYNPINATIAQLPNATKAGLSTATIVNITNSTFFPKAVGPAFMSGFKNAAMITAAMLFIAALLSAFRKGYSRKRAKGI